MKLITNLLQVQSTKYKTVLEYRNSQVINSYAVEYSLTYEEAENCFIELIKFLQVSSTSMTPCVPSKKVDDIWHIFIMHTKAYRDFCYQYFQSFIDHNPGSNPNSESYFMNTIEEIQKRFGAINQNIWGLEPRKPFILKEDGYTTGGRGGGGEYTGCTSCNGEKTRNSGCCWVVTAYYYGDPFHPKVNEIRELRSWLLTSSFSSIFNAINNLYLFIGQTKFGFWFANKVSNNGFLRFLTGYLCQFLLFLNRVHAN